MDDNEKEDTNPLGKEFRSWLESIEATRNKIAEAMTGQNDRLRKQIEEINKPLKNLTDEILDANKKYSIENLERKLPNFDFLSTINLNKKPLINIRVVTDLDIEVNVVQRSEEIVIYIKNKEQV